MKSIERFLIHFLITIVLLTITLDGILNSPRVSAMFTIAIILILINRFFIGYTDEKQ
jgi:hypothetical protein